MIRATFNSLGYANGDIFEPPIIGTSTNGWVYRPDLIRTPREIKRGLNKSFDRDTGHTDGRVWLQQHIDDHFAERDWERPISADNPVTTVDTDSGDSFTIAWQDSVFGWVSIGCTVYQKGSDNYRHRYNPTADVDTITLKVTMHPVLAYLVKRSSEKSAHQYGASTTAEWIIADVDASNMPRFVNEWISDPWNVTIKQFTEKVDGWSSDHMFGATLGARLERYLPTAPSREAFNTADFQLDRDGYGEDLEANDAGIWSSSNANALYFRKGVIEKIMASDVNWKAITELIGALQFTGYELSIHRDHLPTDWDKEFISGFSIKIPAQGNTHDHTIKVNAANPRVTVNCGFIRDEARWVDAEKRKAVDQMNALESDLRTFEIDLGEEGVE